MPLINHASARPFDCAQGDRRKNVSFRAKYSLSPLSFRAKSRNLVETNSFFFPATRLCRCLGVLPRGLSGAATKQRFREMFRQAQHDRKLFSFVPLIDLYVSFLFVRATTGRPFSVEAPNTARALRSECFPLRHSERVRLRPCHSERSRGISWKRTVRLDYCSAVILNAVFLLPRDKILLFFKYSPARVKFMP